MYVINGHLWITTFILVLWIEKCRVGTLPFILEERIYFFPFKKKNTVLAALSVPGSFNKIATKPSYVFLLIHVLYILIIILSSISFVVKVSSMPLMVIYMLPIAETLSLLNSRIDSKQINTRTKSRTCLAALHMYYDILGWKLN